MTTRGERTQRSFAVIGKPFAGPAQFLGQGRLQKWDTLASESIDTQGGRQAVKVINYDCVGKRLTKDCEYLNLA